MLERYCRNRYRRATGFLVMTLAFIMGESAASGQVKTTPKPTTVTTELACHHLYLRLADGPNSANYKTRVQMLQGSGLSAPEIAVVIRAANAYAAAVAPVEAQAAAMRQRVRDKTIAPGEALPQFKGMQQQREDLFATSFNQLKVDLGPDGASKLETFLNDVVKPTIRAYTN